MNKSVIEKVVINNPIGNLYRKNHVLVLVVDKDKNFILGKKKDFYPENISRMLGGGINTGEDPVQSAKREIKEELTLDIPVNSFKLLGNVITQALTTEGNMEMQTWIYSVELPDIVGIKPSDDISGVQFFTYKQYVDLIQTMSSLSGEFITNKFSFLWSDWGKIYGPIHQYGLEWYTNICDK
jgi:ADP-ribose pyrophosphatase YjhB (NUDIX family)